MPLGFCNPPVCWDLVFDFTKITLIAIKPADVPNWNKGFPLPANQFQNLVNAFQIQLNATRAKACDTDCVCVRLHKKRVTVKYTPQKIGPHPAGKTDIYMDNIFATGWWGMCAKKGWIKVKKGDDWVPVEDLEAPDVMTPDPGSGSSGGGKKKKGKKGGKGKRRR